MLLIANWKQNFSWNEAEEWLQELSPRLKEKKELEIVICPPFPFLPLLSQWRNREKLNISLGAQDISPFPDGAHTGEVGWRQLSSWAQWVIIGHSERRQLGENNEIITAKIKQALQGGLKIVLCLRSKEDWPALDWSLEKIKNRLFLAFEPEEAIGSGKPASLESVNKFKEQIASTPVRDFPVLYGGSINARTVTEFIKLSSLKGFLVGSASWKAKEFKALIDVLS